jgi:RHS repeat-associated protein
MSEPYTYTYNGCGSHPPRATEADAFQDELNTWSGTCGLETTRNGWLTSEETVWACGFTVSPPNYTYGVEVFNASNYTFRHWQSCSDPTVVEESNYAVFRNRNTMCPAGYTPYSGGEYTGPWLCRRSANGMEPQKSLGPPCPGCGNPINPAIGNKYQEETDYVGGGSEPLLLRRYYNSALEWPNTKTFFSAATWVNSSLGYGEFGRLAMHEDEPRFRLMAPDANGAQWRHHYQRAIYLNATSSITTAIAYRHDGRVVTFNLYQGNFVAQADINDSLVQLPDGHFEYSVAQDQSVETYTAEGYLASIRDRSGQTQSVTYDACQRIASVIDDFGHQLQFHYEDDCSSASRVYRITSVTLPDGTDVTYGYNSANGTLTDVTYPDGAVRSYTYGGSNGRLLTGIVDEQSQAYASWSYDQYDRAKSSQHAGGAAAVTVAYTKTGSYVPLWSIQRADVTDTFGTTTKYYYNDYVGTNRITRIERPQPSGSGTMSEYWTYDARGNVATYKNNRTVRTNYAYEPTRNLETSRTEGLSSGGAADSSTRTTTTQWHPTLRLPTLISVYAGATATGTPKRTTSFTYDATGNVLTRIVTDPATSSSRTWTWTYDSYGRVLTADGPRTDVSDVTAYTYYTCSTSFECGQRATVTDAAGHVTSYLTYNAHGQPLTLTDTNGVLTTLSYDARQRLTSRSVGGETTTFDYWPTGLLKRVTLADASWLEYSYDAAHRLIGIADDEGNHISYTLDAMGNRIQEDTFDPTSALTRTHSRTVGFLNHISAEIGSANTPAVTTNLTYDNNGNLKTTAAPLGRSTSQNYDRLDRTSSVVDPLSGTTAYLYDPTDNLTRVTDPRGLMTDYTYDGLGDLTQLSSPDTGVTIYNHDAGGNLTVQTDARGATATSGYDALNRVTSVTYPDQVIAYTYDTGNYGNGRLTAVTDASGSTSWTYTAQGRVASRSALIAGITRTVGYGYNGAGQLTSLTYPSGVVVDFGYTNGKVTSITSGSETLVTGVLYDPFGPIRGWTWGNSSQAVRAYDLDGNLSQLDSGGLKTYALDDAFRITGITDTVDSTRSWTYGYDLLDRLTAASRTGLTQGWSYDANGNRLAQTGSVPSTYTVASTSNRLNSVSGGLSRSYVYDAAGNTTADGAATFTYNAAGRMVTATKGATTATYARNALGQRVRKTVDGVTTLFAYDEAGHLLGEYEASGALIREYVWLGDIPVAVITGGPGTPPYLYWYIHSDHLNTPRMIENPTTTDIVWRWDSVPFGETAPDEDPDGDMVLFTMPLRMPGQSYDAETGLHYNYFRDYEPRTGQYVQSDPIGIVAGPSTYAYVRGNPVAWLDALGLLECTYMIDARELRCNNDAGEELIVSGDHVKSGKGKCQDKSECIAKSDEGPLPPGDYRIHKPGYSPNRPKWLYLRPSPDNDMHERSEFFIHPWGVSNGCITIFFNTDFAKLARWANEDGGGSLRVDK